MEIATAKILVVLDKPDVHRCVANVLESAGAQAVVASSPEEGLDLLERRPFQVMLADGEMPGMNDEFVRSAVSIQPRISVVMLAQPGWLDSAVQRFKVPRIDYLVKPLTVDAVRLGLRRALDRYQGFSQRETIPHAMRETASPPAGSGPAWKEEVVARSAAMREVLMLARKIARSDAPVLIQGEFGVGKGMVAREIHRHSRRAAGPLVHVACGALREAELEGKLFNRSPAEPPAGEPRQASLFDSARGGTLFLDGVTQLPYWAQARLLDMLLGCHRRGPDDPPAAVADVRLMASSSLDLRREVVAGRFCSGLYYYLNATEIYIPPLRNRQEDIRALGERLLIEARAACGGSGNGVARRFSEAAWGLLLSYDWPGNAVQLASVITRAVVLAEAGEEIAAPCVAGLLVPSAGPSEAETIAVPVVGGLREMELLIIREVIRRCRGNKAAAARSLRLHRRTLYRLLEEGPG